MAVCSTAVTHARARFGQTNDHDPLKKASLKHVQFYGKTEGGVFALISRKPPAILCDMICERQTRELPIDPPTRYLSDRPSESPGPTSNGSPAVPEHG